MANPTKIVIRDVEASANNIRLQIPNVYDNQTAYNIVLRNVNAVDTTIVLRENVAGASGVIGTLSASIGTITLSGAAVVPINADLSASIGTITLSGAAVVPIQATLDTTIGSVILTADGTVSGAVGPPIIATMTASIGEITLFTGAKVIPIRPTHITTRSQYFLASKNGRYISRKIRRN